MQIVVTGAAGFIGSTLAERLLTLGHEVTGVDCFSDYYSPSQKRKNIEVLNSNPKFEFIELDLASDELDGIGAPVAIFHQAGQPGVRASWGAGFDQYVRANVLSTQRVLEYSVANSVQRFVYASSSSVYGDAERFPTRETDLPKPKSPYGATKLAGEHLTNVYATNFGLPTISLRYFTVYGPRQRPDMAFRRFIEAALDGSELTVFGDGNQVREFTHVDDIVTANVAALSPDLSPGSVLNLSGGATVSVRDVLRAIEEIHGQPLRVRFSGEARGDVRRTGGATTLAREVLGWTPSVDILEGLHSQYDWCLTTRGQ